MKNSNFKDFLAPFIFVSLFFGLIGGALMSWVFISYESLSATESGSLSVTKSGPSSVVEYGEVSYTSAWETASEAVVSVVALKDLSNYYNWFSFNGQQFNLNANGNGESKLSEVSSGTGFIVTPDGLAVTNKHVVADEEAQYVVILADGTELSAEVLDRDTLNDIALIQLSGDDERIGELPTLEFADSDVISVGEPVLAIGNALGEYSNTTTAGIISATGRSLIASGGYGFSESLVGLIQTDAAINPGNSGGPLVNMLGEVIGMNTVIDTTAEGIGFAIPANDIAMIVKSYQEFGRIVRPFLGVRYLMITPGLQQRMSLGVDHGALIIGDQQNGLEAVVEGSSADKAGLRADDVIISFNGQDLNENFSLSNAIAGYFVGETVVLEVWRNGETITLDLTLEEREK